MSHTKPLTVVYERNPAMNDDGGEHWLVDVQGDRRRGGPGTCSDVDWCRDFIGDMGLVEALWGDRDGEPVEFADAKKVLLRGTMRSEPAGSYDGYYEWDTYFDLEHVAVLDPEPVCVGCYALHERAACPEIGCG